MLSIMGKIAEDIKANKVFYIKKMLSRLLISFKHLQTNAIMVKKKHPCFLHLFWQEYQKKMALLVLCSMNTPLEGAI